MSTTTGSRTMIRLLERHKNTLAARLESPHLLQRLNGKGVISQAEQDMLLDESDVLMRTEAFMHVIAAKGFNAFRELCLALETECPQLLTALLLDSAEGVSALHSRENSLTTKSPVATKINNRYLEMARSPSQGSLSGLRGDDACGAAAGASAAAAAGEEDPKASHITQLHELLEEPVDETLDTDEHRVSWEFHRVELERFPGYGFGIAVSGGKDNPHFTNGDPSIAISDVLITGPADGKLRVHDRILSANSISFENVDYAQAIKVLKDCPNTVELLIKRRIVRTTGDNDASDSPVPVQVTLNRNRNEPVGLVLKQQLVVVEIVDGSPADREGSIRQGDVLNSIEGFDNLSLSEVNKILESTMNQETLKLSLERSSAAGPPQVTQAETRASKETPNGPLEDKGDSVVDQSKALEEQGQEEYGPASTSIDDSSLPVDQVDSAPVSQSRVLSFEKKGPVGIRLAGGNEAGLYVAAVQSGSSAALQGLVPGDEIQQVNDQSLAGVTREQAVKILMGLQDRVTIKAQYKGAEYQKVLGSLRGDSFYVRSHLNYSNPENLEETSFRKGQVFHVVDTLHNGLIGSWQAFRIGEPTPDWTGTLSHWQEKCVIPNETRAQEIFLKHTLSSSGLNKSDDFATLKRGSNSSASPSSFFRRRREKAKWRSKSMGKDQWDELLWADSPSHAGPYERIVLKQLEFQRPIVLFGAATDVARKRLLSTEPTKFNFIQNDNKSDSSTVVRISQIHAQQLKDCKHVILDVIPSAVNRLNAAQLYPIVIFLNATSKQTIKACRGDYMRKSVASSKVLEHCSKLKQLWSHVFTATLDLDQFTTEDAWFHHLASLIEQQQKASVWVSEKPKKPTQSDDDYLFPWNSASHMSSLPLETTGPSSGPINRPPSTPNKPEMQTFASPERLVKDPLPPPPPPAILNGLSPMKPAEGSKMNGSLDHLPLPPPPVSVMHPEENPVQNGMDNKENKPGYVSRPLPMPPKVDRQNKPVSKVGLVPIVRAKSSLEPSVVKNYQYKMVYEDNYDSYKYSAASRRLPLWAESKPGETQQESPGHRAKGWSRTLPKPVPPPKPKQIVSWSQRDSNAASTEPEPSYLNASDVQAMSAVAKDESYGGVTSPYGNSSPRRVIQGRPGSSRPNGDYGYYGYASRGPQQQQPQQQPQSLQMT